MVIKHVQYDDETHQLIALDAITGERLASEIEAAPIPVVLEVDGKVFVAISDFFDEAEGVYFEKATPHRSFDGETLYLV